MLGSICGRPATGLWDHGIPADLWWDDLTDGPLTPANKERCH